MRLLELGTPARGQKRCGGGVWRELGDSSRPRKTEHVFQRQLQSTLECQGLIKSMYVDDVNTGSNSVVEGFEFYEKAKTCLGSAMFNLRKWASNSEELMDLIPEEREQRDLQAEPAVIDKPDSVSDNIINDPENCKT